MEPFDIATSAAPPTVRAHGTSSTGLPELADGGARHAAHYLTGGVRSAALQTVLDRAAASLDFPLGFVTIGSTDSLHTLAVTGSTNLPAVVARADAPCDAVIRTGAAVAIQDLTAIEDPAPLDAPAYPALVSAGMRAYLGVPLRGREGTVVGSLCLMDTSPHLLAAADSVLLQAQAEIVEDELELRRRRSALSSVLTEHAGPPDAAPAGDAGAREAGGRTPELPDVGVVAATADLRRGLTAGEIVVHYEPIVDLVSGDLHGFEALARWQHPSRGLLHPAAFIPLAEDSDLVIDLDLVVLQEAARQLRRWQERRPGLSVNVNLSGRHLAYPDCVDRIRHVVDRAGVDPADIGLEITESAFVAMTTQAVAFVEDLRSSGFRIFFDDFGTGWASLTYLLHLPADAVKIDRSFTAALSTRTGDALVRAVLLLARDLGLETVVEGITRAESAAHARALGCRLAQGYFYSPPLPAAQVRW